ncbi:ABC transporter substrate-binding protein [Methanosphaerula palustris]|uniref:ABC-type nitrate/sulfonate/bicarbonate transport systems periplasmic components-like protein n=1 Tax=Methanosphaerula palustris (strain ATCC BAA-1556 / DSM 19958 / E1-9c) TaxID=521011 RepID=B8GH93_METPE|nr:ABC transporter substrate-binding protein [Methanosphaerula palustris]ACL16498.1 ABC-type nitrate/sulfonate/bicarbonate transport systems periplasmic components-like protein [Methanosphaerula palustris E1-9c]
MSAQQSLRIGHLSTMYHTAFLLRGSQILEDRGIEATWKLFPSGPDIIKAMQAGTLDLGYIGLPPVIIGIDHGLPLACIAGGHIEGTIIIAGEEILPLTAFCSMSEFLEQFSGKAIGTPPQGSIHDVIVRELLREHSIDDVAVKNYPWADFLPDALAKGEIAAAAGTPALAVTARRYGRANLMVPPDKIWPFNPSYGIVVMRRMLEQKDLLLHFLSAHEDACELIRHDPRSAAGIVARTTGMVDLEFVMDTYGISPKYCASLPPEYISSTLKFMRTLYELGYISQHVGEDAIFEPSLIRSIHPGPHHYNDGILH